jgi:hypothetical protein
MGTAKEWQVFILGILWGLMLFRFIPLMVKDVLKMFKEIKKRPAALTAERGKKNINKYSITNSCKDFYSQDIERWASDERN